jgi:hypothetical protein
MEAMTSHLAMIPNSSVFADDRDALRAKHQVSQAQLSLRTIEGLLNKRKFAEATTEINNHRALWGENEKVAVLMRSVQQQKGKASQDTERMRQARLLLRQGSHLAALKVFEGPKMSALERGLHKKLVRFKDELALGRQGLKSKSGAKALKAFQSAKDSYVRLARSSEKTPFTRALNQNLANAHYLLGASSYPSAPCKGASLFRQAHVLAPDDLKIKQRIDGMRLEADRVYREAKATSKMNPKGAHQKAAAALCLVPKGSALYRSLKSL